MTKKNNTNNTGLIFDIKKCALHDGPGIRTTVFFKGCPLDCKWCHNPESRNAEPESFRLADCRGDQLLSGKTHETVGRTVTVDEVMNELLKDLIFYEQSGGGVTFSGGEPMIQADFLKAVLQDCKAEGLHTAVDTSGYVDYVEFEKLKGLVDLYLYDIKLIDDRSHQEYVEVSNRLILENLKQLYTNGANLHLRFPMIPGITDTDENLEASALFVADLSDVKEVSLMPYNKMGEDKADRFGLPIRVGRLVTQDIGWLKQKAILFERLGCNVLIGG